MRSFALAIVLATLSACPKKSTEPATPAAVAAIP
jgi:hypothetical protein